MLHVLMLTFVALLVAVLVRAALGASSPPWSLWIQPLTTTLLWPLADALLLWPQRRPLNRDENRPL